MSGSSTSGGACRGLIRASMTSGPAQPQCLSSIEAPTPSTSAAGFDRVNVTQRKFRNDRATNSLSSTTTTNGNAWIVSPSIDSQNRRIDPSPGRYAGPFDGQNARKGDARRSEPVGQVKPARKLGRQRPRTGPAAATTTFEPALKPWPE